MKRILDEKTKRKLAGLLPFSPDAFVVWTPTEFLDFPIDVQPKFNIRPFDKITTAMIRAESAANNWGIEVARKAIQYAVTGWTDLIDLGTQLEIQFSPESFLSLPDALVMLIYTKVSEMTFGLSPEEKEALELQPVSESVPLSKAAESADSIPA